MQKIIEITKEIEKLYNLLYELEIKGEKNSEYYLVTLETLKRNIKIENSLYEKLNEEEIKIQGDLFENKLHKKIDKINLRIFEKLVNKKSNLHKEKIIKSNMNIQKKRIALFNYLINFELKDACNFDLLLAAAYFVEEFAHEPKLRQLREILLGNKYQEAFISSTIENSLIDNKFELNNIYTTAHLVLSSIGLTDEQTLFEIDNIYTKNLNEFVNELINIREYGKQDNQVSSILLQATIKASLVLINEGTFLACKDDILEQLENEDGISKNILIGIFADIKEEREKIKVLSFFKPIK